MSRFGVIFAAIEVLLGLLGSGVAVLLMHAPAPLCWLSLLALLGAAFGFGCAVHIIRVEVRDHRSERAR